jgi:hypothetical protein
MPSTGVKTDQPCPECPDGYVVVYPNRPPMLIQAECSESCGWND